MKDSRPGSGGRHHRGSDESSRAEGGKSKPSGGDDEARRRGGGSAGASSDTGLSSRPSSKSSSRESSASPPRSPRRSDGSVSPPATVTPPRGSPKDAQRSPPKKRSSDHPAAPATPDARRSASPRAGEKPKSVRQEGPGAAGGRAQGSGDGRSSSAVGAPASGNNGGPVVESADLGLGFDEGTAVRPETAPGGGTSVRGAPSPDPLGKTDKATPSRATPLTPSPESSKSEVAPPAEDDSEELAGERVLGVEFGGGSGGSGGDGVVAEETPAPAVPKADGVESDERVTVELGSMSNEKMDAEMRDAGTAAAAATPAASPSPQAEIVAAVAAASRPPAEMLGLQERSGVTTAVHDLAPANRTAGQTKESASGKKRPRPFKTAGSSPPKAAGPVPPGGSLLAQIPAAGAGAAARPLTANGKRSPASGKAGAKDKARGRGGSEKKGRAGSGGGGGTSAGFSPAPPQARRTPRAAAVVAAGKIKSTSEGGGVLGATGAGGAGIGLLGVGSGGGGLSAFQSYGPGGPTADDSEEEATLEELSPPSRGVSPLPSASGSKPMDPHQWFLAKTKVAEMIALDRNKVYTSSPEQSIGKGKEYKSYLAMVQTPIWLQKIQNKIAGRKMDCRCVCVDVCGCAWMNCCRPAFFFFS